MGSGSAVKTAVSERVVLGASGEMLKRRKLKLTAEPKDPELSLLEPEEPKTTLLERCLSELGSQNGKYRKPDV